MSPALEGSHTLFCSCLNNIIYSCLYEMLQGLESHFETMKGLVVEGHRSPHLIILPLEV